jgi:hypothetical protein
LYCVESPESWFEDFGKGQLECGRADVALDSDFAAVADLSEYHVFLTGYNCQHPLHVTDQTSTGFTVAAIAASSLNTAPAATVSGTFSWRVVAKRKDIAGPRLEPVTIPREPTLPPVPDVADRHATGQARSLSGSGPVSK